MTVLSDIHELDEALTALADDNVPDIIARLKEAREGLLHQVTMQVLLVYFDASFVRDDESALSTVYKMIGGEGACGRDLCGPIFEAVAQYDITFTREGNLIVGDGAIARACAARGFSTEVEPDWQLTKLANGRSLLTKKHK